MQPSYSSRFNYLGLGIFREVATNRGYLFLLGRPLLVYDRQVPHNDCVDHKP